VKLTKAQIDHFVTRLDAKRATYIAKHRGTEPKVPELTLAQMHAQIVDGTAKLKSDVDIDEYMQLRHAFNFVKTPEMLAAEAAYAAWDKHDDEVRAEAQKIYNAAMDKLMFMGTGEDIMKLLDSSFE
jgi:hypothetical protein